MQFCSYSNIINLDMEVFFKIKSGIAILPVKKAITRKALIILFFYQN